MFRQLLRPINSTSLLLLMAVAGCATMGQPDLTANHLPPDDATAIRGQDPMDGLYCDSCQGKCKSKSRFSWFHKSDSCNSCDGCDSCGKSKHSFFQKKDKDCGECDGCDSCGKSKRSFFHKKDKDCGECDGCDSCKAGKFGKCKGCGSKCCLSGGCCHLRSLAIPEIYPVGAVQRAHFHQMQTNAEAMDFILFQKDFVLETAELTPDGKDKVLEIAARMRSAPFPVVVERTYNNANPELDAHRRAIIAQILTDLGNPDANNRTFVANAYGPGKTSLEGAPEYYQFIFTGNNQNNNGFGGGGGGGFGGGGGGGFGGGGGGFGGGGFGAFGF